MLRSRFSILNLHHYTNLLINSIIILFCNLLHAFHKGLGDFPCKRIGYPFCKRVNDAKSLFGYPNPVLDIPPFNYFSESLYYVFPISMPAKFSTNKNAPVNLLLMRYQIGTKITLPPLTRCQLGAIYPLFSYTLFSHRKSKIQHIFSDLPILLLFGRICFISFLFCTLKNSFVGKTIDYALQHNLCDLICKLLNLVS